LIIRNCLAICKEILAILIVYLAGDIFISGIDMSRGPAAITAVTAVHGAKVLFLLFVLSRRRRRSPDVPSPASRLKGSSLTMGAALVAGGAAALFLANSLSGLIPGPSGDIALVPAQGFQARAATVALVMASVIAEELMFRAYLIPALTGAGASRFAAVVGAGVLFAAGHGYLGLSGLVFAFSSALILGYLFLYSEKILVPVLAHLTYNLVILAAHSYI
jgi:membrane protease YdiL (CAAX protease family)